MIPQIKIETEIDGEINEVIADVLTVNFRAKTMRVRYLIEKSGKTTTVLKNRSLDLFFNEYDVINKKRKKG